LHDDPKISAVAGRFELTLDIEGEIQALTDIGQCHVIAGTPGTGRRQRIDDLLF